MGKVDILKLSFEFSSKLGIRELPDLNSKHESNIKGLYVVGDLADAPIIKVALNQGHQVATHIMGELGGATQSDSGVLDVIVIGAGPAGIGAALALKEAGASYLLLEKERPFNTIQNFPKAKFVFSEPKSIENRGNFWFDDAQKEFLVDRWAEEVESHGLAIQQPEEVVDVQKDNKIFTVQTKVGENGLMEVVNPALGSTPDEGATNTYKARRIILAIGRRGSVRKMKIPGEELEKVAYNLKDPDEHSGRKVMVFGGGDSAVEAAVACADAGAEVTVSYRKDGFHRAKLGNQQNIDARIASGDIRFEAGTMPKEIKPESVVLARGDEEIEVPNDDVLVFFGTKLPKPFLDKIGLRFAGQMDFWRVAWILTFAALTYCFYVLKTKKAFFPFGETPLGPSGNWFGPGGLTGLDIPSLLQMDLGFRTVDASFWGTCTYAVLILVFGIIAYRKYPLMEQKKRYLSLITFQMFFLFGIPELLGPLIIEGGRGFKLYAFSVPWPLSIWSVIEGPNWGPGGSNAAIGWMLVGCLSSFVLIPLYVRFNGERFCSYMCGCGGLAETLGDFWRHLAPRGTTSYKAEWFGKIILFLAIPVTLMIIVDAWQLIDSETLSDVQKFSTAWYSLMVDFWLASVIGVAFYPYLGNRVWCRFFCPLRAYMEILSKWFSKIAINANDKCIGCGECTRYCQMGIQVQSFAQKQQQFHNGNSACIQCGICIQVCPMEVLSIGERGVHLKIPKTKITTASSP